MWGRSTSRGRALLSGIERLAALRPVAAMGLAIVVLVWAISAIGLTTAIDRDLRRTFYWLRGDRAPTADVVFVAIDHETVAAWGPPPWSWPRYQELVGAIAAGEPRLIALLEPGPRVLPAADPPADLLERAGGRLVLPPPTAGHGQPRLSIDRHGVVEAIELGDPDGIGGRSITATVIDRAGLPGPTGGRLLVDFFGDGRGFPTVAAHRVALGDVPASTFKGRVVVIGTRGERFADQVPTPVGPLSPAEIHVQALHALAADAGVAPAAWWITAALALALILVGLRAVPRPASQLVALAALVVPAIAVVGLAYVAFAHAGVALDVAVPLLGLGLGATAGVLHDRARANVELAELARLAAQRLALDHRDREDDDEAFWRRFSAGSRAYLGHEGAYFARLPVGSLHFEIAYADGVVSLADVKEPRRDVRREPYREAYLRRQPAWARRAFVREELGLRTLIVPLSAWRRMTGLWIVQFRADRPLDDAAIVRRAALMGDELAFALDLRWVRDRLGEGGALQDPGALASRLVEKARAARQNAFALVHAQDARSRLVETLPVGVLTATVWGQVDGVNLAMRRFLALCGVDLGHRPELGDLLAALTGISPTEASALIQQLLDRGGTVKLEASARPAIGPAQHFDVTVARLAATVDGGPDRPIDRAHFALTVSERRPGAAATDRAARWHEARGLDERIDLRKLVGETIEEVRRQRGGAARRPMLLEGAETGAWVLGDRHELRDAMAALVGEYLSHGPVDAPSRIVLDVHPDQAVVRIIDPGTALPDADALALASDDSVFDPGSHLERLSLARKGIVRAAGSFAINSDLARGTVIEIRLPSAPSPSP